MEFSEQTAPQKHAFFYSPLLLWGFWLMWLPFLIPVGMYLWALPSSPAKYLNFVQLTLFVSLYGWLTWNEARRMTSGVSRIFRYLPQKNWRRIDQIATIVLVGLAAAASLSQGAQALGAFIFVSAALSGKYTNVLKGAAILAGLMILSTMTGILIGALGTIIVQNLFLIPVVGVTTTSFIRTINMNYELRSARQEIVRLAVSEERLRFARDLHDLLGHTLSLISIKSELAGHLIIENPQQARQEVLDIETAARAALQEVREAVAGYRKSTLSSELQHAGELLTAAGIHCKIQGDFLHIPASVESVFTWIIREGSTNIVRHSHAKHCAFIFTQQHQQVDLVIEDDGPHRDHVLGVGNGLNGIKERVLNIQGVCEYGPMENRGFRIWVQAPVQEHQNIIAQVEAGTEI